MCGPSTGIEIWDLDTIGAVEPVAVLGGEQAAPSSTMASVEALEAEDVDAKQRCKKAERKKKKVQPLTLLLQAIPVATAASLLAF